MVSWTGWGCVVVRPSTMMVAPRFSPNLGQGFRIIGMATSARLGRKHCVCQGNIKRRLSTIAAPSILEIGRTTCVMVPERCGAKPTSTAVSGRTTCGTVLVFAIGPEPATISRACIVNIIILNILYYYKSLSWHWILDVQTLFFLRTDESMDDIDGPISCYCKC